MTIETKYDIGEKVWLRCSNGLNYHTEIVGITITEDMTLRYQFRGAINWREEHELFATEDELINILRFRRNNYENGKTNTEINVSVQSVHRDMLSDL